MLTNQSTNVGFTKSLASKVTSGLSAIALLSSMFFSLNAIANGEARKEVTCHTRAGVTFCCTSSASGVSCG
jgi:predicted benzoate:H+ symporter BenE